MVGIPCFFTIVISNHTLLYAPVNIQRTRHITVGTYLHFKNKGSRPSADEANRSWQACSAAEVGMTDCTRSQVLRSLSLANWFMIINVTVPIRAFNHSFCVHTSRLDPFPVKRECLHPCLPIYPVKTIHELLIV